MGENRNCLPVKEGLYQSISEHLSNLRIASVAHIRGCKPWLGMRDWSSGRWKDLLAWGLCRAGSEFQLCCLPALWSWGDYFICPKPSLPICKMGILIVVVDFTGLYGRLENVCKTPRLEPGNSKQSLNLHSILSPPWNPTFSSFMVLVLCYSLFQLFPAPLPRPFSHSLTLACLTFF